MKWTCPDCGAINAELVYTCHNCGLDAPVVQLVAGNSAHEFKIPEPVKEVVPEPFKTLQQVQKEHIILALKTFNSNKTQAASALGITIKTMYNKLHEYGLFDQYKSHNKDETSS